jgi:hypothetical protein
MAQSGVGAYESVIDRLRLDPLAPARCDRRHSRQFGSHTFCDAYDRHRRLTVFFIQAADSLARAITQVEGEEITESAKGVTSIGVDVIRDSRKLEGVRAPAGGCEARASRAHGEPKAVMMEGATIET